jgi:O-antigen/teichoic acid export membrane protein
VAPRADTSRYRLRRRTLQLAAAARRSLPKAARTLSAGTIAAQAFALCALPVLTRIFSPSDFGVLSMFTAVVAGVAVAACLRFDVAIPLPAREHEAGGLLALSFLSAAFVSSVLAAALSVFGNRVSASESFPAVPGWPLFLIPPAVFLAACATALQSWGLRKHEYRTVATGRFVYVGVATAAQIALGLLLGSGPLALLVGVCLAYSTQASFLLHKLRKSASAGLRANPLPSLARLSIEYRRFPIYSTWESLANSASIYLPILLIAAISGAREAGHIAMATYLLQAPLALIGGALGQAFIATAPERERAGTLSQYVTTTIGGLIRLGSGPLLMAAAISPFAFPLAFGEQWARSGNLVPWMMPWFFLQLIVSPVSMALHVRSAQRVALLLQIVGLILRGATVYLAAVLVPHQVGEWYSVTGAVFYLLYLGVVLKITGVSSRQLIGLVASLWRSVRYWVLGAAALFAFAKWIVFGS